MISAIKSSEGFIINRPKKQRKIKPTEARTHQKFFRDMNDKKENEESTSAILLTLTHDHMELTWGQCG